MLRLLQDVTDFQVSVDVLLNNITSCCERSSAYASSSDSKGTFALSLDSIISLAQNLKYVQS